MHADKKAGTLQITLSAKSMALLALSAAMVYGAFTMLKTSQAAPTTLSGVCGGVFNLRTAADGAIANNDEFSINAGTYINFSTNKISFVLTDQAVDNSGNSSWSQTSFTDRSFTLIADPELTDAYQMTIPSGGGLNTTIVARLIPVNSGNTVLIQGKSLGATGMCQKV